MQAKYLFYVFFGLVFAILMFMLVFPVQSKRSLSEMPIDEARELSAGSHIPESSDVQEVQLRALGTGFYDKKTIYVKAGKPVRLLFSAEPSAGCGRQLIIDEFGINIVSRKGETVAASFIPEKPGVYPYHCAMNMFRGEIVAT